MNEIKVFFAPNTHTLSATPSPQLEPIKQLKHDTRYILHLAVCVNSTYIQQVDVLTGSCIFTSLNVFCKRLDSIISLNLFTSLNLFQVPCLSVTWLCWFVVICLCWHNIVQFVAWCLLVKVYTVQMASSYYIESFILDVVKHAG